MVFDHDKCPTRFPHWSAAVPERVSYTRKKVGMLKLGVLEKSNKLKFTETALYLGEVSKKPQNSRYSNLETGDLGKNFKL